MADFSVELESRIDNHLGRFMAHCEEAAQRSVDEAAEEGARVARMFAPRSGSYRRRTGPHMADTITATSAAFHQSANKLSATATFSVGTNHWQYTQRGAPPHGITGNVSFYWVREGRRWNRGTNTIRHPGTRAVHFMDRGYEAAREELKTAVRRNY